MPSQNNQPHYFEFSTNWAGRERLCKACDQTYDAGQHIEITTLKPFTHYICPNDGGLLGHRSIYTGAYLPSLRGLRDHLCSCGAELVEEDHEQWEISFEVGDGIGGWRPVSAIRSRHAAEQQERGLRNLIEQGEPIRNVQLHELVRKDVGR